MLFVPKYGIMNPSIVIAATTEGYSRREGFIKPPLPRPLRRRAPQLWYNNLTALPKSKISTHRRRLHHDSLAFLARNARRPNSDLSGIAAAIMI